MQQFQNEIRMVNDLVVQYQIRKMFIAFLCLDTWTYRFNDDFSVDVLKQSRLKSVNVHSVKNTNLSSNKSKKKEIRK